jgi:hypothetical protein
MVGPPFRDRLAIVEIGEMQDHSVEASSSAMSCLLRLVWILVGPGALYLALGMIAANGAPLPSHFDAIAAAAIAVILGTRWLDITRHGGRTVYGEPATLWHWRRHALMLLGLAVPVWLLVHRLAGSSVI